MAKQKKEAHPAGGSGDTTLENLAATIPLSLKESEEKFRSVVEQSPNGIYLLSPEGEIVEWNRSMEQITELTHEEVVGRHISAVMYSLMRDEIKNQQMFNRMSNGTQAFISTGKTARHDISIENIIQCKSGIRRHLEIVLIRVKLEKGALAGGIVQDITARKQAEEALKRSLEEMTALSAIAIKGSLANNQQDLLDSTLGIICRSLASEMCYIQLFENDDRHISRLSLACDPSPTCLPVHFSNRLIESVHKGSTSYRVNNSQAQSIQTYLGDAQSAMCLPIKIADEIIGVLYAERPITQPYMPEDETMFWTISGQLSTAIAKVRLMEMLEKKVTDRTRQLSILYDILAIANETKDLSIIMDRSLQKVISIAHCTEGALYMYDEEAGRLHLTAFHNIGENDLKKLEKHFATLEQRAGNAGQGASYAVEDPFGSIVVTSPYEKYFFVPLRAHSREMGGVVIPRTAIQKMRNEDKALLVSVADQIGIAVETFKLRKKAEEAAVLEERERLSRELHDSVTQLLYSLTLFSKTGLEFASRGDLQNTKARLATISEVSQQALKEMRLMVYELKPQMLEQDGFEQAIRNRLESVEEHLGIHTELYVTLAKIPPRLERQLYFIIQEALNNVLKHSKAGNVSIHLTADNGVLELEISDDGVGFSPDLITGKCGMGLTNIKKSIESINGKLDIRSSPGEGTRILVKVGL